MDFVLTSLVEILSHFGHKRAVPAWGEYSPDWDLIKCVEAKLDAFRVPMDAGASPELKAAFAHLDDVLKGKGDPLPVFRDALVSCRRGYERAKTVQQKVDFTKLMVMIGFFVGCECPGNGTPSTSQLVEGRNRAEAAVCQLLEEELVLQAFEVEENMRSPDYSMMDRHKVLKDVKLIMTTIDTLPPTRPTSFLHKQLNNGINVYHVLRKKSQSKVLKGHGSGAVSALAVGENGVLFSGSFDKSIRVWNDKGPGVGFEIVQILKGHNDSVEALVVDEEGVLFSGSLDMSIRVWAVEEFSPGTYACIQKLRGHRSGVTCLAVSIGGVLFSGTIDSTIRVWSRMENSTKKNCYECVQVLSGHTSKICSLAIHWSDVLFSASFDYSIRVWRIHDPGTDYECDQILQGHGDCVNHLAVDESGALFSGSSDKTIRVWLRKGFLKQMAIHSYECVRVLKGNQEVSCLLACLDGMLYSGSFDGTVQVWCAEDSYDYKSIQSLRGHNGLVPCLVTTKKGMLISGSFDDSIRLWFDLF
ncbi:hypothetical protein BSKO_05309 [Bryopsis sp. KO-2023]|nr:hypothetical protein BSKO_05309 [Bryopsis sp. KO-2023]